MKRIISLLLALTVVVGCMTVLSSCGQEDSGAEIEVYLGNEVYDLDPSDYFVSDNAAQFMSLLFEPLFRLDEDGKLEEAAADSYEIDEEKREIRVVLRESYWSDGNRVVPNDFIFAWERLLNPENSNPAAALLYDIEGALEVKTGAASSLYSAGANNYGDGKTILINYREGANPEQLLKNLASIATAPVRQSIFESAPEFWSKGVSSIATNGAFMLAVYNTVTGEICLERNVGYHQPRESKNYDKHVLPYKLVNFWTANDRMATLSYADIEREKPVFFLGEASKQARADSKFKDAAEVYDALSTFTLAFTSDNEIFKDAAVRKALSAALDRNAIAAALGFGKAATGFLPTAVKGANGNAFLPSKTIAVAKDASAALPAAVRGASITVALNKDAKNEVIGEAIKAAWGPNGLGLNVTVTYVTTKTLTVFDEALGGNVNYADSAIQFAVKTAAEGGDCGYDIVGFDWQMYSADPFVALASLSSKLNGNGFVPTSDSVQGTDEFRKPLAVWTAAKAQEYDTLIDAAYKAKDAATRDSKLASAAGLIAEDIPVIPVVFNQHFSVTAKGLSRVEVDYFGNFSFARAKLRKYTKYFVYEAETEE